jgi:TatD DNase family protein
MIDTHCHIDLYDSPLEVAAAAEKLAIKTVAVTYLPSHFVLATEHLAPFKHVRPSLGLHPLAVKDHAGELALFANCIASAEYIGEVGLDFSGPNRASMVTQRKSFEMVVEHIRKSPKLVTVHSRGAEDTVLDILRAGGGGPVVFHWFSGSKRQLGNLLDAGHRISVNTAMSSTAKWAELITYVPRSSLLTETDGPFVKIGGRPAIPADVEQVMSWLTAPWNLSLDQVSHQVSANLDRLMVDLQSNAVQC